MKIAVVRSPLPIGELFGKAVVDGVAMDVLDDGGVVAVSSYFFALKGAYKQRTSALVELVECFGVGVEEMTKL